MFFLAAELLFIPPLAVRAQEPIRYRAGTSPDSLAGLLERLARDSSRVDLLVEICSQYTMRSDFRAIDRYIARLYDLGRRTRDERALIYADFYTGQSLLLSRGTDSTRLYLTRALDRAQRIGDSVALSRICNALGIYTAGVGMDYRGGITYFLRAMDYARGEAMARLHLAAQCNLANVYYMRNDPAGLKYAEEVYLRSRERGFDYLAFGGAVICAYMHYLLGEQDRALEYLLLTLPETDRYGYHTEIYSLYANILHAQGDDARAEHYYRMALDHVDDDVVPAGIFAYLSYGAYLNDRGRYAEAVAPLQRGLALSVENSNTVHRYQIYRELSEAEAALGDYRRALDYYRIFHKEADSIFNVEREHSINELRIRYEAEQQENALRRKELDLVRQQRKQQITLLALLFMGLAAGGIWLLYWRKNRMYRQIVLQQHAFLRRERQLAAQAAAQASAPEPDADERADRDEALFRRIEQLMAGGIYRQNDLTIERLAELLGTNRTYLSHAINRGAGKTFSGYLNGYRIDEAVRRLSDVADDTPLKALAQSLGYNHLQTFYTAFQSQIGMPPSKYRKKLLELHDEHRL